MTEPEAPALNLLQFSLGGDRVKRAAQNLAREAPRLAAALRRALPFLTRREVPISVAYARAMPPDELLRTLVQPVHATHLVVSPGGGVGTIVFDAVATGLLLDGVLGGDGSQVPELQPSGLTGAQTALMVGLASGVVKSVSAAIKASLGVSLSLIQSQGHDGVTSAPVTCLIEIGCAGAIGRVAIQLPREALLDTRDEVVVQAGSTDPRIVSVLEEVELDVVAELGSVRLNLGQVARLRVGDMLRLDAIVGATVSVRAEGAELFRGLPTTSGGRIALRLVSGHED